MKQFLCRTGTTALQWLFVAILLFPLWARAEPWDDQADRTVGILHGPMAKKIAVIAIAALGIVCFRGKLPVAAMACVIVGILFIAKGDAIVSYFW